MYLGNINVRMPNGSLVSVPDSDVAQFGALIHGQGGIPLRPDGSAFTQTQAFGGDLWDNCPIQVAAEEYGSHSRATWVPSQVEALKGAGINPTCLVPGSPNYYAFHGYGSTTPDSGTGTRASTSIVTTLSQPAIFPTGVATPSIQPLPGGGSAFIPAETLFGDSSEGPQTAGAGAPADFLPWVVAGLALLFVIPSSKPRGRRR